MLPFVIVDICLCVFCYCLSYCYSFLCIFLLLIFLFTIIILVYVSYYCFSFLFVLLLLLLFVSSYYYCNSVIYFLILAYVIYLIVINYFITRVRSFHSRNSFTLVFFCNCHISVDICCDYYFHYFLIHFTSNLSSRYQLMFVFIYLISFNAYS